MLRLGLTCAALCLAGFALAGCIDTKTCPMPSAWKPCSGETAEAGASGTPPSIVDLELPTCASLTAPTATGTLHISDPDGDAQVIKVTLYNGARASEAEAELDDAERSGNDWTGPIDVVIMTAAGGMPMEGSSDVRVKVTDRAGGQSVPFCNSIALVQ